MRALTLLPVAALAAACADEPEQPYDHQAGSYAIEFITEWDGGTCDFETIYANFDPVSTTVEPDAAAGTMDVAFDDGDQVLTCELDTNSVSCPEVELYQTDLASDGKQAVVTVAFGLSGDWTSDTAFSGTYAHRFTCEGEDCAALDGTAYGAGAAFPCDLTGAYEASLQ